MIRPHQGAYKVLVKLRMVKVDVFVTRMILIIYHTVLITMFDRVMFQI